MPSLFELSFQQIGHFSLIFRVLIGLRISIFTIAFEITMKLLLHLLLPILLPLLLEYFFFDILKYQPSFKVDYCCFLGALIFLFLNHLVLETFMQPIWLDEWDCLSIYIWLSDVVRVLLFIHWAIYILEAMPHMVQTWFLVQIHWFYRCVLQIALLSQYLRVFSRFTPTFISMLKRIARKLVYQASSLSFDGFVVRDSIAIV